MTLKIKRLDHHGIISGVIDDLGLVEVIDSHISQDEQQEITTGEAVKGMIMNGLGFSNRPLSLSPQFFTNLPMEHLFREGVEASHFNRHKLGRTLDQCFNFGTETLFALISGQACQKENVDQQFHSLDTTSFSLSGQYNSKKSEEELEQTAIEITHGYSKDHRSDLKQVVQEMIVSQDGGVPLACKSWDGNASDNKIFKERTKALVKSFKSSDMPRCLVGDSKLYHQKNAEFLSQLTFLTRIPSTNKEEQQQISQALSENKWCTIDENYKYVMARVKHMDIKQRWMVIYSSAANERVKQTMTKQVKKVQSQTEKELFHLQAQRFACEADANKALKLVEKKLKYHIICEQETIQHIQYEGKGRPTKNTTKSILWQVIAKIEEAPKAIQQVILQRSCFVLGTNADESEIADKDILYRYKEQSHVERGFRFLKDPIFFVSSLFIKKPSRIDALLMVMLLSLLIYSIAQRRMRATMKQQGAMVPNQINTPIPSPTLRWIFQCFEGINILQTTDEYEYQAIALDGMDELRQRIVTYLGLKVAYLYKSQNYEARG